MGRLKYKEVARRKRLKDSSSDLEETLESYDGSIDDSDNFDGSSQDDGLKVVDSEVAPESAGPVEVLVPEQSADELNDAAEEVLATPGVGSPHLTGWEIVPSLYGADNNTLILSVNGEDKVHMEVTSDSVLELLYSLNEEIGEPLVDPLLKIDGKASKPDSWIITVPEDPTYSPIIYFKSQGQILMGLDLTDELLDSLLPRLKKIRGVPEKNGGFLGWVSNNRVKTTIGLAVIGFGLFYGIVSSYL